MFIIQRDYMSGGDLMCFFCVAEAHRSSLLFLDQIVTLDQNRIRLLLKAIIPCDRYGR